MASLKSSLLIAVILLLACDPVRSIISTQCGLALASCIGSYGLTKLGDPNGCNAYHSFNTCTSHAVNGGPCTTQDVNGYAGVSGIRSNEAHCSSAIPKTSLALVVAAAVISFFMKA